MTTPVLTSNEAKLLYALLDAAEDDGRLSGDSLLRWRDAKTTTLGFRPPQRVVLFELINDVANEGALENTWMHERWLKVKDRVEKQPMAFSPTSPPFPFTDTRYGHA